MSWRYGWGDWGYVGWAPLGPHLGLARRVRRRARVRAVREPYAFCGDGRALRAERGRAHRHGRGRSRRSRPTRSRGSPRGRRWAGASRRIRASNGPPPSVLRIPASNIAHGVVNQRGVAQARAFAHPSTAMALGARAPAGRSRRNARVGGRIAGVRLAGRRRTSAASSGTASAAARSTSGPRTRRRRPACTTAAGRTARRTVAPGAALGRVGRLLRRRAQLLRFAVLRLGLLARPGLRWRRIPPAGGAPEQRSLEWRKLVGGGILRRAPWRQQRLARRRR